MPVVNRKDDAAAEGALVSHTGVPLTRATTFRFTIDPTPAQSERLFQHAGAFRKAFNHHVGRVKANLDQRAAESSYGISEADLTPRLSWSKVSFINHMNAWKDGRDPSAEVHTLEDGTVVRGLPWRDQVSTDMFETASVNAAQALKNWAESRSGKRPGKQIGFRAVQVQAQDDTDVPAPRQVQGGHGVAGPAHRPEDGQVPQAR